MSNVSPPTTKSNAPSASDKASPPPKIQGSGALVIKGTTKATSMAMLTSSNASPPTTMTKIVVRPNVDPIVINEIEFLDPRFKARLEEKLRQRENIICLAIKKALDTYFG